MKKPEGWNMISGTTKAEDDRLVQETLDDLEHCLRRGEIDVDDARHDRLYRHALDCLVVSARLRAEIRIDEGVVSRLLRAYIQAEKDVEMRPDGPPPSWLKRLKMTEAAEADSKIKESS